LHDYRLAASLAQEAIKQEDAKYYQAIADQAAQTHKVEGLQGLWKRLRAVQPKHRTKRQHQRRDIDVELQQHFETLEVGSSQPKQALLTACMHRNAQEQQLLDGPIQLQLCELPTLCEIEQHCLNQSPGKAPGPDGIPSDLCRYGAAAIAPQLHSVLCKAFLHGVEPATYKGGNLCAIFKGKGSEEDAGGYRGIILADSFAKISHAWARSRLLPTLQHRRTIGQLGGLPSQQTITAAQLVRLHNAVGQSKSLSTATLFIDLKAAFHHMIRELIFATRNNLLKTTLSSFLDENEFDIDQLHHD
jgi:DNA-binding FadR family transcriptional regulator